MNVFSTPRSLRAVGGPFPGGMKKNSNHDSFLEKNLAVRVRRSEALKELKNPRKLAAFVQILLVYKTTLDNRFLIIIAGF